MAIQVFPEFVCYNLSVETVNIGWINDRAVLRSPWSSPKYPGLQNEFLFLKGIFLLSFLFRNCVSLNPLLWLCFKNCFCQRHNAPNDHTCLCQQISESFFWSERKKRRDWRYSTGYKHYQYKNNQKFYQHLYQTKTSEKNASWFICKILYSYNGFLVYGCRICCYSH